MLLAPFLPQNFQGPFHSTDPWGGGGGLSKHLAVPSLCHLLPQA